MSAAGLIEAQKKMRAAGVNSAAVDVFSHYYGQLEAGATGLILEDSIEPLLTPDALAGIAIDDETARDAFAKTAISAGVSPLVAKAARKAAFASSVSPGVLRIAAAACTSSGERSCCADKRAVSSGRATMGAAEEAKAAQPAKHKTRHLRAILGAPLSCACVRFSSSCSASRS